MEDRDLKDAESREFGRRVREELARRRVSRQALADMARISLSTLEKALAGTRPFTLASKLRIEEALGPPFRPADAAPAAPQAAPENLGAYVRAAVRWLEQPYLTIRPSFSEPGALFAYVTEIGWRDELGYLTFAEQRRLDAQFEQRGEVSLPNLSGHIYLITNDSGQHRVIILSRPTGGGTMFGVLTTLQVGHGSQLVPSCCPIVLTPMAGREGAEIGTIQPESRSFDGYRQLLQRATANDYARFHLL
jgi:transcriptional regulator with XRE-family HTH domain